MWLNAHSFIFSEFTVLEIQNPQSGMLDVYFAIVSVLTLGDNVFLTSGKFLGDPKICSLRF